MKTFWFVLISLCLTCPAFAQGDKLNVIATNSIVADWVKNVAGDAVFLITLVGPDTDVHTFEPTPLDNVALSKADLSFEVGLGLEHWMNKLYLASQSHAKRIVLTHQVIYEPLKIEGHSKNDVEPHVWQNVRYVIGMVQRIDASLEAADPARAALYKQNAQRYLKELEDLDNWIINQVASLPKAKRQLVTNHDSLGYFCERYHFSVLGAAFNSVTTEAEDPSARDMADLIFKIKQSGVLVVFGENTNNSKFISALSKEAKVRLAPPLYTDALGGKSSPADTYIHMMRYNVETIVSELKNEKGTL